MYITVFILFKRTIIGGALRYTAVRCQMSATQGVYNHNRVIRACPVTTDCIVAMSSSENNNNTGLVLVLSLIHI